MILPSLCGVAALLLVDAKPPDLRRHVIGGLELLAPPSAEVTRRAATEETSLVAVTDGDEALVVVRYASKAAPSADRALKTHVAEAEARTKGPDTRRTAFKAWFLGKERPGVEITHRRGETLWVTRLVAARAPGQTLVAAWTLPQSGLARSFTPALLRSIALERP